MKHIPLILITIYLCLVKTSGLDADNISRQNDRLRVGYMEFAPYSFTDTSGAAKGFSIDIVRYVLGEEQEVEFVPFHNPGEIVSGISNGEIDMSILLAITEARAKHGQYSNAASVFSVSTFVLNASPFRTHQNLVGRNIGATRGSFSARAAAQIPFAHIIETDSQAAQLVALLQGELDAIAMPTETFDHQLTQMALHGLVRKIGDPLAAQDLGFLVSNARRDILPSINERIQSGLQNNKFTQLRNHWFPTAPGFWTKPGAIYLAGSAGMVLLSALLFALTYARHRTVRSQFEKDEKNALLIEALRHVDLAMVIYNRDFNVVHWNAEMERAFPELLRSLQTGINMQDLIRLSYDQNLIEPSRNPAEVDKLLKELTQNLRAGRMSERTIKTRNGRCFEAQEFKLSEELYVSIRKDITRQQQQALKIETQRDELAEANQRLSEFSSLAAHDLATPLRQLECVYHYIEDDLADARIKLQDETRAIIAQAKSSVSRMRKLVEDLLSYARAGNVEELRENCNVGEVAKDALSLIDVPDGFEVHIDPVSVYVQVPRAGLAVVFRNLLSNACRYHDKDTGLISVRFQQHEANVSITVEDDGPGIPDHHSERVFLPFQRLTAQHETPGTGLGLSLARRTVEGWGGRIILKTSENRGAVFCFTAPYSNVDCRNSTTAPNQAA